MSEDAVEFSLARLTPGMAVELRDKEGKILACGGLTHVQKTATQITLATAHSENLPDCSATVFFTPRTLILQTIEYVEIVAAYSEFYAYANSTWQKATWTKPIRRAGQAFETSASAWRRYTHPPKAIPGVFWPELRITAGGYIMTHTRDRGVPVSIAADFKLHPKLYAASLFLEGTFAARLANGNSDVVSPNNFFIGQLGVAYAFFMRQLFALSATLAGGVIDYSLNDSPSAQGGGLGVRPFLSVGFLTTWYLFTNNRDFHKISLVLQPVVGMVFNPGAGSMSDHPWLFELKMGVGYAY